MRKENKFEVRAKKASEHVVAKTTINENEKSVLNNEKNIFCWYVCMHAN